MQVRVSFTKELAVILRKSSPGLWEGVDGAAKRSDSRPHKSQGRHSAVPLTMQGLWVLEIVLKDAA